MSYKKVAALSEIPVGEAKVVDVDGEDVALFHVSGKVYAIQNSCIHQGGPLAEGFLEGNIVTCPWHSWKYDITTGCTTFNPEMSVRCYKTKVEGDDILVEV